MKETLSSFVRDAEVEEEYDTAAAASFALGAYLFASEMYQNGRLYREGVGALLRSIEIDNRVGNNDRAKQTVSFLREHIGPVVDDGTEPVVRGLGQEWLGDSLFIIGDTEAVPAYQSALGEFDHIDFDTQLYWGASSEYDAAFLPMKRFFERRDIEYFDRHDIDFSGRVEWKIAMCDRLLE